MQVTEAGEGMWQVEWTPIKASALPKGDRLQYLLELQEGGDWQKVSLPWVTAQS